MGEKLEKMLAGMPLEQLKKGLLPVTGVLVATAIIVALLWQSNNHYTMLFGSQENISTAQVAEVLSGENISYRIEPQSGHFLVREDDLPKARLMLAAKGINAHSPSGYELMDTEEMLGSSQFIQNVRFKRSLEGELAQSIMALDAVEFARVHLGISEASSFVLSNKPDSTASVMLRLRYGQQLTDEQVMAIVNLVAGSVPGMKSQQVQVIDQHGALLSANLDELSSGYNGNKSSSEMIQRLRQETERNLENVLIPLVGRENFRISVVPRVNFNQVEETQERFLGEPRTSQETLHQENTTDQLAIGIPGSLSNLPNVPATGNNPAQLNPSQFLTRNDAQRQFNYDRDIRHIRYPRYQLEKLSVAVVLNQNIPAVSGWTEDNQLHIKQMLDQAAGIDAQRGDTLTLNQLSFVHIEPYIEPVLPWWERQNIIDWAIRGGIALLVLLITLFGLLPMMRRLGQRERGQRQAVPVGGASVASSTEGLTNGRRSVLGMPSGSFEDDNNLPTQASGLETKIAYLQTLAKSESDRVADVIKQWISSNERNTNSRK